MQIHPGASKKCNLTYIIQCSNCLLEGKVTQYYGETHRTFWDRIIEHKKALKTKDTSYGVAWHWLNDHPELLELPLFTYKVGKVCRSSIETQIWEEIEIAT